MPALPSLSRGLELTLAAINILATIEREGGIGTFGFATQQLASRLTAILIDAGIPVQSVVSQLLARQPPDVTSFDVTEATESALAAAFAAANVGRMS